MNRYKVNLEVTFDVPAELVYKLDRATITLPDFFKKVPPQLGIEYIEATYSEEGNPFYAVGDDSDGRIVNAVVAGKPELVI